MGDGALCYGALEIVGLLLLLFIIITMRWKLSKLYTVYNEIAIVLSVTITSINQLLDVNCDEFCSIIQPKALKSIA